MKRYQITELFQIALREYPELSEMYIDIKGSKEYSCIPESFNSYIITYSNLEHDKDKYYLNNICSYLQDKYKFKDSVKMIKEFENVFSFLHEIGHIINMNAIDNESIYYNNFKQATYSSYKEAFISYRDIPVETLADTTAVNLLIKYNKEIYSIMNNVSIDEAIEEIAFWNEL